MKQPLVPGGPGSTRSPRDSQTSFSSSNHHAGMGGTSCSRSTVSSVMGAETQPIAFGGATGRLTKEQYAKLAHENGADGEVDSSVTSDLMIAVSCALMCVFVFGWNNGNVCTPCPHPYHIPLPPMFALLLTLNTGAPTAPTRCPCPHLTLVRRLTRHRLISSRIWASN